MITATFATMPGRIKNAERVFNDLSMQVDEVRVHTNGFTMPFSYSGPEDLGDAGKFAMNPLEGYHIVCDDDLFYPPDFVEYMVGKVEQYDRKAVICLGGKRFDWLPVTRFISGYTANYRILGAVRRDVQVHAPLTCGVAYHTDTIQLTSDDFPLTHRNMADLHMGRACAKQGVPVICAAHGKDWITHQPINTGTIWRDTVEDDSLQTELVNSVKWNELLGQPIS